MGNYGDLAGKRVVITGAASGIGLAAARRFVSEKARVLILDRNKELLDKATTDIPELYGGVLADVDRAEEVKESFQKVDTMLGGVDVLIANGGWVFDEYRW